MNTAMNKSDQEYFKKKLLAEKKVLEEDLRGISRRDPNKHWEATAGNIEIDPADENEIADKLEEFEDNSGIASKLETQLKDVNDALEKIEKDTYGICEACKEPIEKGRLEANPAARVSLQHMH